MKIKYFFIDIVRWFGKQVCRVKGHDFFFPGGCIDSYSAYTCVRCGELSRSLDSLPTMPDDEWEAHGFGPDNDEIEREHERARRWSARIRYPKWI